MLASRHKHTHKHHAAHTQTRHETRHSTPGPHPTQQANLEIRVGIAPGVVSKLLLARDTLLRLELRVLARFDALLLPLQCLCSPARLRLRPALTCGLLLRDQTASAFQTTPKPYTLLPTP